MKWMDRGLSLVENYQCDIFSMNQYIPVLYFPYLYTFDIIQYLLVIMKSSLEV